MPELENYVLSFRKELNQVNLLLNVNNHNKH